MRTSSLVLCIFLTLVTREVRSNGDFDWVQDEFAEKKESDAFLFENPTVIGNRGTRSDDVLKYPLSKIYRKDKLQVSECRVCDVSGLKVGCSQTKYIKPCGIEGSYALKSSYLESRVEECGGGRNTIPLMASFVRDVRATETEYALVLDGTRRFLIEAFCVRGRVHECRRFPKHARCPDEILESDTGMCAYGRLLDQLDGKFTDEDLDSFGEAKEAVMAAFEWKVPDFRVCKDLELNKRRDEKANKMRNLYGKPYEGRSIDAPIQVETTVGFERKEKMFLKFIVQKEVENGEYQVEHKISPAQVEKVLNAECPSTLSLIADAFHEIGPEWRKKDAFRKTKMDDTPEYVRKEAQKLWAKLGKKTHEKAMKAKKDRNREIDKSGMTQEVKDQLGHDWWKQIAKGAPSRKAVYKQDAHPVFEFGSSTYLEPPERHILRMVIAGLPRRIRASGEQRTPYGTLFVATRDNKDTSLSEEYQAALLRSASKCLRETNIRIIEINPIHRKSLASDDDVFPLEPPVDWVEKASIYENTTSGGVRTEIDGDRNTYRGENVVLDWEGYSIDGASHLGWSSVSILLTSDMPGKNISGEEVRAMHGASEAEYERTEYFKDKQGNRQSRSVKLKCAPPKYQNIAPCLGYAEKPSVFRVLDKTKGHDPLLKHERADVKTAQAMGSFVLILFALVTFGAFFFIALSREQRFVVWAMAKAQNIQLRNKFAALVAKKERKEIRAAAKNASV